MQIDIRVMDEIDVGHELLEAFLYLLGGLPGETSSHIIPPLLHCFRKTFRNKHFKHFILILTPDGLRLCLRLLIATHVSGRLHHRHIAGKLRRRRKLRLRLLITTQIGGKLQGRRIGGKLRQRQKLRLRLLITTQIGGKLQGRRVGGKLRQRQKLRLRLLITTHIGGNNVVFVPSPDRMILRQRLKLRGPLKLSWSHVGGKQ
ncbi:hypothetical protein AAHE18_18G236900 [Arachis hypogaea]